MVCRFLRVLPRLLHSALHKVYDMVQSAKPQGVEIERASGAFTDGLFAALKKEQEDWGETLTRRRVP